MKATLEVRRQGEIPYFQLLIEETGQRIPIALDLKTLSSRFGPGDDLNLEILVAAATIYALDKTSSRHATRDSWTRNFELCLPVSDPATWNRAKTPLSRALEFLTGDYWALTFVQRVDELVLGSIVQDRRFPNATVASLFSGGLDSFAGVAERLRTTDDGIALVGHLDTPGPGAAQLRLHDALETTNPGRTALSTMRIRPAGVKQVEPTLRSRSLVFLALGVYAAKSIGKAVPLLVPENGVIAINIPLTPSRLGSCSTRTTHPYFLELVAEALATLGISNPIHNPLRLCTKGEAAQRCEHNLLVTAVRDSVSCAHPTRRMQWVRRQARNCGYCVPCLIRRGGLHHVGQDDGQDYGLDVLAEELDLRSGSARDARAMLQCLRDVRTKKQVAVRALITGPLGNEQTSHIDTVERGLIELRDLIRAKGTSNVKLRAGL